MKRKITRKPRRSKSTETATKGDDRLLDILDATPTGMMLVERNSRIIAMADYATAIKYDPSLKPAWEPIINQVKRKMNK